MLKLEARNFLDRPYITCLQNFVASIERGKRKMKRTKAGEEKTEVNEENFLWILE